MPDRMDELVALLDAVLPSEPGGPNVFEHEAASRWYCLPNPATGGNTPFHIVTSDKSCLSGQIGLGVGLFGSAGSLAVNGHAYVPLFGYSPSGVTVIAGKDDYPWKIGFGCTLSEVVTSQGGLAFDQFSIDFKVYLGGTAPTVGIAFTNSADESYDRTFNGFACLADETVGYGILTALINSGALDQYLLDAPYTVGDILEAGHFVRREPCLKPENLADPAGFAKHLAGNADPALQLPAVAVATG